MRRVRRVLLVCVAVLIGWNAWFYFFPRAPREAPLARLEPKPGPALVLVPHSDDEALAAGGLLQQLEGAGAHPYVVLVTGGDGFKLAAEAHYRKPRVTSDEMLRFGQDRLTESKAALAALGLPPERLIFLGYPDQGLNRLWLECWKVEHPCTSRTTGKASVPYAQARTLGAPYAGEALLKELEEIIRSVKPATIFYPHPNEAHVDHWGLSNFTAAALEELRQTESDWQPPEEWLYLVHRGDWPAPKGFDPKGALLPPEKLVGGMTTWHTRSLSSDEVARKEAAVRAYHSQTAILQRYMESFIRSNELFGHIERTYLPVSPDPTRAPAPDTPPWTEFAWTQAVTDPVGDTFARQVERGADLLGLWAVRDGTRLYLAARLSASPGSGVVVRLFARGLAATGGWSDLAEADVGANGALRGNAFGSTRAVVRSERRGDWTLAVFSLAELGQPKSVVINAETHSRGLLIDRTAWRPVVLDGR